MSSGRSRQSCRAGIEAPETQLLPRADGPPLRIKGNLIARHGAEASAPQIRLFSRSGRGLAVAVLMAEDQGAIAYARSVKTLDDAMAYLETLTEATLSPARGGQKPKKRKRLDAAETQSQLWIRADAASAAREFAVLAGEAMSDWQKLEFRHDG